MSTFLTWFLKEVPVSLSVTELLMCILTFGSYYRAKISNTVFPMGGNLFILIYSGYNFGCLN